MSYENEHESQLPSIWEVFNRKLKAAVKNDVRFERLRGSDGIRVITREVRSVFQGLFGRRHRDLLTSLPHVRCASFAYDGKTLIMNLELPEDICQGLGLSGAKQAVRAPL